MEKVTRTYIFLIIFLAGVSFLIGCQDQQTNDSRNSGSTRPTELGPTIGDLAQVLDPQPIPVEGYGIVGNLPGTGSTQCPTNLRSYLNRFMLSKLNDGQIDIDSFIDSPQTAVVWLKAIIPEGVYPGQEFDVIVSAIPGTGTLSIENGWLYEAELFPRGAVGVSNPIATVEGPVFIDKINIVNPDKDAGFIIGGGVSKYEFDAPINVPQNDPRLTNAIRNKINERFGPSIATPISTDRIKLAIPLNFRDNGLKFAAMVRSCYLQDSKELINARAKYHVQQLANGKDDAEKYAAEIALEALGREALVHIQVLLKSSDEQIRFRAARVMLILGSDLGYQALMEMLLDSQCPYRYDALIAIGTHARQSVAVSTTKKMLQDSDLIMVMTAYDQLRKLNDNTISKQFIGRSFYLEKVGLAGRRAVFVTRTGKPRVAIFSGPILFKKGIVLEYDSGNIIIDSLRNQQYVSITRKYPDRNTVIGPLLCSFELNDIITTLCEEPTTTGRPSARGLGVSYSELTLILKQMCDKNIIIAEFWAGPLP